MGKLLYLKMQRVSAIFFQILIMFPMGLTDTCFFSTNDCHEGLDLTGLIFSESENKDGCAPPIESLMKKATHCLDRDLPTTQTASLIAASFRT